MGEKYSVVAAKDLPSLNNENMVKNIKYIVIDGDDVKQIQQTVVDKYLGETYIKKTELTAYATNTDLTAYATNTDLTAYATNTDLTAYATNTDLTAYALLEDVNNTFTNIDKQFQNTVQLTFIFADDTKKTYAFVVNPIEDQSADESESPENSQS